MERISLTGLAVKGLVKGAKVDAFKVLGTGFDTTAFAIGETDQQGRYALTATSETAYAGPAIVRVAWQQGAKIVCDASQCIDTDGTRWSFAEEYDLPNDFELYAAVPYVVSSADSLIENQGNVSSLTHVAAEFIRAQAEVNRAQVNAGNDRVRILFGLPETISLTGTVPADVSQGGDDADQMAYGILTSAISDYANAQNQDVANVLSTLATEFNANNGQLLWNNNDTSRSAEISILDILDAAANVVTALNNNSISFPADASSSITTYKTTVEAKDDGLSDVVPAVVSISDDVAVTAGDAVQLNVTVSNLTADQYSTAWTQTEGPAVGLTGDSSDNVSFVAPNGGGMITLAATVTVTATGYKTREFVRIDVTPLPGSASTAVGDYHFQSVSTEFSVSADANSPFVRIFLAGDYSPTLAITDNGGNEIKVNISGEQSMRFVEAVYIGNQDTQSTGYERADVSDAISGEIRNEDDEFVGTIDSLNRIFFSFPEEGQVDQQAYELELAQNIVFEPLTENAFMATRNARALRYGLDENGEQDANQLKERISRNEQMLILKQDTDASAANMSNVFGMIHLTWEMDGARIIDLRSGLERWDFKDNNQDRALFDVLPELKSDNESTYTLRQRYIHEVKFDGVYEVLDTPEEDALKYQTSVLTDEIEFSAIGTAGFTVSSTGRLMVSVPAIDPAGQSLSFDGMVSNDQQLLSGALYVKALRGDINNTDIPVLGRTQMLGVDIDSAAPDLANQSFTIQGIIYGVFGGFGTVESELVQGEIVFDDNGTPSVKGESLIEALSTRNYTQSRLQETFDSVAESTTWQTTFATNGRVSLYGDNSEDGTATAMEGYVSRNGQLLILRYDDVDFQNSTGPETQGLLIGRKL